MCGIGGILTSQKNTVPETLENLNRLLHHRGPDGNGVWISSDGSMGLNHTRLSILDLSDAGHQPFVSEDQRYVMTYNGEVYNYIELRCQLEQAGYRFQSKTDSEVVLKAYMHWGKDCFHKFNGMWAIAIYDQTTKELLLCRDRFGVKPLYYAEIGGTFAFASEITAIYRGVRANWNLNRNTIVSLSHGSFDFHGTTKTFVEEITNLPGGHFLVKKLGESSRVNQWYQLPRQRTDLPFSEQKEKFLEIFKDACRIRLRSDVEIGTCLSGGLDSGSITSLISEMGETGETESGFRHKAFCAAFPNTQIDEMELATELANKKGVNLSVLSLQPPPITELEEGMRACDGPMHALAFYPIWKLYRHIKASGVTVTLDGQGPDEMLGGYRPIREGLRAARQLKKPLWYYDVYRTYAAQGENPQFSSKKFARKMVLSDLREALSNPFPKTQVSGGHYAIPSQDFGNDMDNSLYHQFFQSPLPGILNQYDRCSMASGVECRMPFMDYRLVEFIFSLPVESKIGDGYTKRIQRAAVEGLVPDAIRLNKVKIGFNAPMIEWFQAPHMREWIMDISASQKMLQNDYVDAKAFREALDGFYAAKEKNWNQAWPLWPKMHLVWWLQANQI